ncbi:peptide deformylase [Campylobacter canadensis]|uniref:peptide deformylase n=1 Tax=Campylobacter canadensis TaxID=449520 RepID=UPI001CCD00B3|nr:peptide deformylase [Campylobacter canadensis]MBZ7995588.1 peptide deformylase [Campylobacter canadensis]
MKLDILTYPNPILFQKCNEISVIDDDLRKFLDDMYDTMIASNGIGLAAIQVGVNKRIFIINLLNEESIQDKKDLIEFINPVITPIGDAKQIYEEGCLSVPGFFEEVTRYDSIKVEYYDRFNNKKTLEANGPLAVAIQHENDHLDGHLFIEKISFNAKKKFEKHYKESKKRKKNK